MIFKFKSDDIENDVNSLISDCIIINTIMISLVAIIAWGLKGSWLYNTESYWVEIFLFVFAVFQTVSYKKILVLNTLMHIMSLVYCIAVGFLMVSIPFLLVMLFLNIRAFIGVLNYRKTVHRGRFQ